MAKILSLICADHAPFLDEACLRAAGAPLGRDDFCVLAPRLAVEWSIRPTDGAPGAVLGALRAHFAGKPVDVNLIEADQREKKLLVADMDSTMIEQECIDELAAYAGKGSEIAAITDQAMRGNLDFDEALRARVAMLAGLPLTAIEETIRNRLSYMPGGKTLITTMRRRGHYCALVSGGFDVFTGPVANHLGFNSHFGNQLLVREGHLTGAVQSPILGRPAKKMTLLRLAKELNITPTQALALGDGANDLDMIAAAGFGVAFHAKPRTAEAAALRLDHASLTGVLFLQGIAKDDHHETG
ncbi:MAG: phosphoserine phosphatase SerB [Pseudomonadota bacterium]